MASETQKKIAANLDQDAKEATAMGYPETGKNLQEKADAYREATGQQPKK
jgi:hypothetical protein